MSSFPVGLRRSAIIGLVIGAVLTASMFVSGIPGEEWTPWQFVHNALPHIDTVGKALALVFFGTIVTFMNFMALMARLRLSLPIIVVALLAVAALSPAVRQSRLVRTGAVLMGVGVLPLVIAGQFDNNPVGLGFLFAFVTPIAGVLIVSGTLLALTDRESPDDQTSS